MGKIIRDERYTDTIWCLCNNYEEYLQFAKDLFLYTGLYNQYSCEYNDERWIENEYEWSDLFGVPTKSAVDDFGNEWEEAVDPIRDVYNIKEKPNESEYPVVVYYDNCNKNVLWMSLDKLRNTN